VLTYLGDIKTFGGGHKEESYATTWNWEEKRSAAAETSQKTGLAGARGKRNKRQNPVEQRVVDEEEKKRNKAQTQNEELKTHRFTSGLTPLFGKRRREKKVCRH